MNKSNEKTAQQSQVKELICKLREIQVGLQNSLTHLQQTLAKFESDPEIVASLENAKRDAEARASSLETEVKQLREELEAIKDLLGFNADKK